jgi:hypothetical protein
MSVQLIVLPQVNPDGTFTFTATANTLEFVGDSNLNGVVPGGTNGFSQSSQLVGALGMKPPIINKWIRWKTSSAPMYPNFVGGVLELNSNTGSYSKVGLYQLIDNLTPGTSYDIEITFLFGATNSDPTGELIIGNYSGAQTNLGNPAYDTLGASLFVTTGLYPSTVIQETFTAFNTSEILSVIYRGNAGKKIGITKISIKQSQTTANQIYTDINDGQVIVDLYEDTSIPLTLNIDEFKNAAEKPASYSKSFRLPATKRNNQIFSSAFDVTRSTKADLLSFNPHKKTHIRLKEDGYTIFEGLLRLIDISEKDGEVSYNVNLFSDTVSLKDILSNKKLADIDYSELEHTYNSINIENSWTGVLALTNPLALDSHAGTSGASTTSVLKYPLCDWTGTFTIFNPNGFSMQTLEDGFRPWINVKYLVDRIFSDAGYYYDSTFLNTDYFNKLYIDFNSGGDTHGGFLIVKQGSDNSVNYNDNWTAAYTGYTNLKFAEDINNEKLKSQYWTNDHTFTATRNNQQIIMQWGVKLKNYGTGSRSLNIRIRIFNSNGTAVGNAPGSFVAYTMSAGEVWTYSGNAAVFLDDGQYMQMQFVGAADVDKVRQYDDNPNDLDWWKFIVIDENIDDYKLSNSLRGSMSQWDLISGIIKMFNLLVMPSSDGLFNIEPYVNIFQHYTSTNDVEIIDWTDKVNAQEYKLTPMTTLKKKQIFTYKEDSKDYLSSEYSSLLDGYLFGTHTREETDNDFVSGESKIELPFAPTIDKPIFGTSFICPAIFSKKGDDDFSDFESNPRILFDNGVRTGSSGYGYQSPVQNHTTAQFSNETDYLFFSHYERGTPLTGTEDKNYNFGTCQTLGFGPLPSETLYSEYWQPYIDDLYDNDTRQLKLKINLYPSDVSGFRFYDLIQIKNRLYRVNKINYKPGAMSDVELILLG